MDKQAVRKQMRAAKRALSPEERLRQSEAVAARVEQLPQWAEARTVLLYWSMPDEVQTHALADRWLGRKRVLLPCVDGELLRLRQYTGRQCLVEGAQFGIAEPNGVEWTDTEAVDLIVVPGVAFDRAGNRLGRGRGYYDRLLSAVPRAYTVGIGFDFQLVESLPTEPHDRPMDCILCGSQPAIVTR
ncbi:MAG: 5-formyltetrahydrofolate cyclo-ligase [Bacteroidales bacterium]|nr:5-formyltetrahydrofolate cyclo-ligase [Bacteroidales bacterium]